MRTEEMHHRIAIVYELQTIESDYETTSARTPSPLRLAKPTLSLS